MSVSAVLGERRIAETPAGTIEYRERGEGSPVVFVHGVGVNGDLWRGVAPSLAGEHRCIVPDLPWGAHSRPLRADADLSLPGMARIVADAIAATAKSATAVSSHVLTNLIHILLINLWLRETLNDAYCTRKRRTRIAESRKSLRARR